MERSDLEKLTKEQRDALPKGERMFLQPMDESTGKGEEIVVLARRAFIRASQAHDLIMLHGYTGAMALVDRTQGRTSTDNTTADLVQAAPTIADTDTSMHRHAVQDEEPVATEDAKKDRCPSITRAALHMELGENPEWVDILCYLDEGHRGDQHQGWHPELGSLTWVDPFRREGA